MLYWYDGMILYSYMVLLYIIWSVVQRDVVCHTSKYSTVQYEGYSGSTGFRRAMVAIRPYQTQGKNNPFDLHDDHEIMNIKAVPKNCDKI